MKNKPANNFADIFFICIVCESRPRDHEILQNISQKAKTEQKVRGLRYKDQPRKGAVRKRAHGNTVCRHCKIVCVTWIWTDCVVLVPPHAPHRPHGVWLQDGARSAAPIPRCRTRSAAAQGTTPCARTAGCPTWCCTRSPWVCPPTPVNLLPFFLPLF